MVLLRDGLEHRLGQLHVSVLVLVVGISRGRAGVSAAEGKGRSRRARSEGGFSPGRVVDGVNVLLQPRTLFVGERPRLRVAACRVDSHLARHGCGGAGEAREGLKV